MSAFESTAQIAREEVLMLELETGRLREENQRLQEQIRTADYLLYGRGPAPPSGREILHRQVEEANIMQVIMNYNNIAHLLYHTLI